MRAPRRPLSALCAALVVVAGLATVTVAAAPQASAADTDVRINEVESNGDTTDWIELVNTGTEAVDLTGWTLSDNTAASYAIVSGTTLAPGQFLAFDTNVGGNPQGDFGLGSGDTAEVFAPGATTPIDTYTWPTGHSPTTYGRCPDGTGALRVTTAPTKAATNDCSSPVRINEIESEGGTPGDWVELVNPGASAADVSGFVLQDNSTASYVIPAGTSIAAGGLLLLENPAQFTFGLGGSDSVRLFAADATTLVDSYTWTAHATTTYGRCPNPQGAFVTTTSPTKGAANDCGAVVPAGLRFNEVESNGDVAGDFAELKNTTATPIDVSGYQFRDNDVTHVNYVVPAGTTVPAGGYFVLTEAAFGFGLGSPDSVTLWLPDGTTVVDTYSWTAHASTTYGRCPDGTGAFTTTGASTRGATNDCASTVRLNEVESDGGTPGDWIELVNTASTPTDVSGLVVKDSGEPGHVVPAGTTIAAGGHLVVEQAQLGSGLGGADSARLFAADGTTLLDSYSWTTHAATTYGRCPDGRGAFTVTQVVTKGTANNCPGDLVTQPWPGDAEVVTVDPQNTFASNLSGLAYEPSGTADRGTLWASRNGPGALFKLLPTAGGYAPAGGDWAAGKLLRFSDGTGDVDAEGVAFAGGGPAAGMYVAAERNNAVGSVSRPSVLRYLPETPGTSLTPTHEWDLTADLPGLGANLGLEAVAWVPDSYLTARGFVDQNTGAAYVPSTYAGHGDGLFLVGVEQTGRVLAYALDQTAGSGRYTRVASFASGFPAVMELHFEAETQQLWVVCDDTCQGRSAVFDVVGGAFTAQTYYERPAGMPNLNNEGFALAPRAECAVGRKPAYWSDDSSTGGFALRRGSVRCTERVAQAVAFTSTPPASPTVGTSYDVAASGGASGNPVTFASTTPSTCSVTGATVSLTGAGTCTVRADQAGDPARLPGSATQSVTVGRAAQTVTFTSNPPASPVVGQTYLVAATGGASGNPMRFTESSAACTLDDATVTVVAPGPCAVVATQAGDATFSEATATQTRTAVRAASAVTLTVTADRLRAVVGVVAPGAAPVAGDVTFLVDGAFVGTAPVTDGVATLATTVAPGRTRAVQALYGGSPLLDAAQASVQRKDPLVVARLASSAGVTPEGWWSAPVTVTFTCTPQGAPVLDCPEPVVLDRSGTDLGLTRTATAADGGVGTVVVSGVDVDLDAPTVRVGGVVDGETYPLEGPRPECLAADALSGVATCTITSTRRALVTTVTATAVDVAGQTASVSVTWRRPVARIGDALRMTADGRYVVERGTSYRLVALLSARPVPRVLGRPMRAGDVEGGLTTWTAPVRVTGAARDQQVVVRVGNRRVVVRLRVV